MYKTIISLLILGLLVATSATALTASIGNARMVLHPEVPAGETVTIQRSILVRNTNDVPVQIHIEPDPIFNRIGTILDNDFVIDAGAQKEAQFVITLKSGGTYESRLLVKFSPTDPESKETPVGLTSTIVISADGPVTEEYNTMMAEIEAEAKARAERQPEQPPVEETPPTTNGTSNNTVNVGVGNDPANVEQRGEGASPVVGILIILGIVLIGAIIFWIVWKVIQ